MILSLKAVLSCSMLRFAVGSVACACCDVCVHAPMGLSCVGLSRVGLRCVGPFCVGRWCLGQVCVGLWFVGLWRTGHGALQGSEVLSNVPSIQQPGSQPHTPVAVRLFESGVLHRARTMYPSDARGPKASMPMHRQVHALVRRLLEVQVCDTWSGELGVCAGRDACGAAPEGLELHSTWAKCLHIECSRGHGSQEARLCHHE
mmetsp:Transcript_86806/g.144382  ORF Transcript_86806/g.144382 Transcript_86806/m.144382 type:complete len:202 (-) Transcript_86806:3413-4018(-)